MIAAQPDTQHISCALCTSRDVQLWSENWDVEFYTTSDRFNYYRCNDCKVLFIHPMPVDQLHVIYPPNYNNNLIKDSFVNRAKIWLDQVLLKKLLRRLPESELSVLDVGGGYGLQLDVIRHLDPRVTHTCVVDIDQKACAEAGKKGHEIFAGRIEDFKTSRSFNFITLYNLIEHVSDPRAVLQATQSMLTPGGILLVKTPNYDSLDARIFRHKNWCGYHCPRHWILFTKESFENLAHEVGLKVLSFAYTQGAPFWTQSILNWLSDKGLIKITPDNPTNTHPLFPVFGALFAAFDFLRRPFSKTSQMFFVLSR